MVQQQANKNEKRLSDQVHTEDCHCRLVSRQTSEVKRRVRDWFIKKLTPSEILPKEFEDISQRLEGERTRVLWNRFL